MVWTRLCEGTVLLLMWMWCAAGLPWKVPVRAGRLVPRRWSTRTASVQQRRLGFPVQEKVPFWVVLLTCPRAMWSATVPLPFTATRILLSLTVPPVHRVARVSNRHTAERAVRRWKEPRVHQVAHNRNCGEAQATLPPRQRPHLRYHTSNSQGPVLGGNRSH